jgi:hypothetical protein
MRFFLLACLLGLVPISVQAFIPVIVEQRSLDDITTIEDFTLSQTFYGQLPGFPHTYRVVLREPSVLSFGIFAPSNETDTYAISSIIVKEEPEGGRVGEIARLSAKEAAWEEMFDRRTGDTYRRGLSFEKELEAGTYRIEVHTADNVEKYLLIIGTHDDMTLGYGELIRRLAGVKLFFGKSQFRIIESPYLYVPLLSVGLCVLGVVYMLRRRRQDPV